MEKLSNNNLGKWYKNNDKLLKPNYELSEITFFKNLKKIGFRYFNVSKRNYKDKRIIKSFQLHYLPNNVTGKIDKKTFEISHFLTH